MKKLTLAAIQAATSDKATVDEINSVLALDANVRGLVHELSEVIVYHRSGGGWIVSFSDEEILRAVAFLRAASAAAREFNGEAYAIDAE